MKLIKENELFKKCRQQCRDKKRLLPDQAALNKYVCQKLIVSRKFNEQKQEDENTVFRHFSTTFKFWPKFYIQTIKPWDIKNLHETLNIHSFDDVLKQYKIISRRMK